MAGVHGLFSFKKKKFIRTREIRETGLVGVQMYGTP